MLKNVDIEMYSVHNGGLEGKKLQIYDFNIKKIVY